MYQEWKGQEADRDTFKMAMEDVPSWELFLYAFSSYEAQSNIKA